MTDVATSRVCAQTGLRLVRHTGPLYRVGRATRGATPWRPRDAGSDRLEWSRWDTAGGSTLYAAPDPVAAFAEVLGSFKPALPTTPISDLFDDDTSRGSNRALRDMVTAQMPGPGPAMADKILRGWRDTYRLYTLTISAEDWFVDIGEAQSLAAINHRWWTRTHGLESGRLNLGDLTGRNRTLTTGLAEWLRNQTVDDGTQLRGVHYLSKHGANLPAQAIWLRRSDDSGAFSPQDIQTLDEASIEANNPHLIAAAALMGLTVAP